VRVIKSHITSELTDILDSIAHRYIYFEKVRIAEGKKKTPKRERNELQFANGMQFPLPSLL